MAEDIRVQVDSEPSMASLVSGIINDAQQLLRQEVTLAKQEVREELAKAKAVAAAGAIALALAVVGGLLLCLMLVHLLQWATGWPDWVCYGLVGGVFLAVAGVLAAVAKNKASQIDLVPRQTVETIKENVQWLKTQT